MEWILVSLQIAPQNILYNTAKQRLHMNNNVNKHFLRHECFFDVNETALLYKRHSLERVTGLESRRMGKQKGDLYNERCNTTLCINNEETFYWLEE